MEKTIKILHIIYSTCHILQIKKYMCKHLILIYINLRNEYQEYSLGVKAAGA